MRLLRAAIYCRVSTDEQARDGLSIAAQRKLLLDYASAHNMEVVAEYVDEGASGRTAARPQFQLMIKAARSQPRPFDVILVHKTDRFARNREDAIVYKALLRRECGVHVVCASEQFDDTPTGRLLEGLMEVVAEFFSLNLSQEVHKGMKEKALRGGKALGKLPFGYRTEPDGTIGVVPEQAEVVRLIFQQYATGDWSLAQLARELKAKYGRFGLRWSTATLRNMIRNRFYVGCLVWNVRKGRGGQRTWRTPNEWVVVEDSHPAIIQPDVYQKANQVLSQRARRRGRNPQQDYALKGLAFCMDCGSSMCSNTLPHHARQLSCSGYHNHKGCYYNHIPMGLAEAAVVSALRDLLAGFFGLDHLTIAERQETVEPALANPSKTEAQLKRQFELYVAGAITVEQFTQYLQAERSGIAAQPAQGSTSSGQQNGQSRLAEVTARAKAILELMDDPELPAQVRRNALKKVIYRVEWSRRQDVLQITFVV
ncbi:MAG: recombinase family protein [Bacillota bacterium]